MLSSISKKPLTCLQFTQSSSAGTKWPHFTDPGFPTLAIPVALRSDYKLLLQSKRNQRDFNPFLPPDILTSLLLFFQDTGHSYTLEWPAWWLLFNTFNSVTALFTSNLLCSYLCPVFNCNWNIIIVVVLCQMPKEQKHDDVKLKGHKS